MSRFSRIFLAVTLLVILAAAVWELSRPRVTIAISGKFSPDDIAAISTAVKKDLRKGILPDLSWASFKSIPPRLKFYLQYEIASIHEGLLSGAMVEIKNSHKSVQPDLACELIKGTNGWQVDTNAFIMGSGGYVEIWQGPFPVINSDETNSNGAKK